MVTTNIDRANCVSSVTGVKPGEATKTYAASFTYAAHGAVASMQLGNNLWEHTTFNSRLQPVQIGLGTSAADASTLRLNYAYGTTDNNGNVASQTITVPGGPTLTQSYAYDSLNRVQSATENNGVPSWTQVYSYDRFGNRSFAAGTNIPATRPNLAFDAATNRISGGQGYTYDAAGNVTGEPSGSTYLYDAENRQVSYNGGQATYGYDGDGRRVQKIAGSVTTLFIYNMEGQMVAEYAMNGVSSGGGTSYLTADTLGSPRVVTDASGNVKARHDYLPFGEEVSANVGGRTTAQGYSQVDNVRQQFTGYERDGETGLDYAQARYYASQKGRFTSVDPLLASGAPATPQSWNRYAYAFNNPLVYTDPTGLINDYYIERDGYIYEIETSDSFDRFYVQEGINFTLAATLERNAEGLVQFPDSGTGFNRYSTVDAGGTDTNPRTGQVIEEVGQGDHYLQPLVAAALFGLTQRLSEAGFTVSLGDMSSSNGSDPWQPGGIHHGGHGHLGTRSGSDIDFRYLNGDGVSFQSPTATTDSQFNTANNQALFDRAVQFGFTGNYQGTAGSSLTGTSRIRGHNDHGHLGFGDGNKFSRADDALANKLRAMTRN